VQAGQSQTDPILRRPSFLWTFLGSVGYALAITFPWILKPARLLGGQADNFECAWRFWWFKERLLHGGNPLFVPNVFYPFGLNLAMGELSPLMIIMGMPANLLFGEVAAYNSLVLSAFTIAAFSTFWFAWDVTHDATGAAIAGLVYAASPFLTTHALGHLALLGYCWFPYLFWALHRITCERRPRYAIHAAVALTMVNYSGLYLAAIAAVGVLAWFLFARPGETPWRQWVKPFLLIAVLAGVCFLPLAVAYLSAQTAGVKVGHWGIRAIKGAPILSFVLPSSLHPLFGHLTRLILGDPRVTLENNVSLGIIALLLALWAARRGPDRRQDVRAYWAVAGAGMVLALGPILMKTGVQPLLLPIPIPEAIRARFSLPDKLTGLPIPLPAAVLALLPVFSGMRAYQRFAVLANLAIAILAGVGVARIRELMSPRRHGLVAAALAALILLEFAPWPFETARPAPRAVDRWLSRIPGEFSILEYPLPNAENGPHLYYSRFHGKRLAFGYTAFFQPSYIQQRNAYATLPSAEGMQALAKADVHFILVDQRADTAAHLSAFLGSPHFRLETVLESISVFSIRPESLANVIPQ
jgi:hypothetical protein